MRRFLWAGLPSLDPPFFLFETDVNLLAMHLDLGRCLNAQFHLPGANLDDRDLDAVTDPDVLAELPR